MRYIKFLAAGVLSLALFACQNGKTPESLSPVLKPATADDVIVSAEGGNSTFAYILENPAEGGKLTVTTESELISELDWDKSGNVVFTVAPNYTSSERVAGITVTYEWPEAETPLTFTKSVKQSPYDGSVPSLRPADDEEVTVAAEGGRYTFSYILENPVENGKLSVETSPYWISELKSDNNGNVTFIVAPNELAEAREAEIKVSYEWPEAGITLSFVKILKQEGNKGPVAEIVLEILELLPGEMTFRVTPADKEMFVVATAAQKSYVDYYGKTDDGLFQEDLNYWRECANTFGKSFLEVLDKQGKVGMYEITTYIGAESGEECCLYAYGCTYEEDPVRLTDIVKVYFTAK